MINHELPGYPSIDRPWLKYYRQEVIVSSLPDGSIYDELLASCKDTPDAPALNYYGKKTTYGDLLKNIMLAAKAWRKSRRYRYVIQLKHSRNDILHICSELSWRGSQS